MGEIEEPELAAAIDRQTVVAAVAREAGAEVIDHLREGERDHDEVDAARAQTQQADDQRDQRGNEERDRPLHEPGRDALARKNADGVAADSQIGGVAEAHHAAIADQEIEAGRYQGVDQHPRCEHHVERLADRQHNERQQRQRRGSGQR